MITKNTTKQTYTIYLDTIKKTFKLSDEFLTNARKMIDSDANMSFFSAFAETINLVNNVASHNEHSLRNICSEYAKSNRRTFEALIRSTRQNITLSVDLYIKNILIMDDKSEFYISGRIDVEGRILSIVLKKKINFLYIGSYDNCMCEIPRYVHLDPITASSNSSKQLLVLPAQPIIKSNKFEYTPDDITLCVLSDSFFAPIFLSIKLDQNIVMQQLGIEKIEGTPEQQMFFLSRLLNKLREFVGNNKITEMVEELSSCQITTPENGNCSQKQWSDSSNTLIEKSEVDNKKKMESGVYIEISHDAKWLFDRLNNLIATIEAIDDITKIGKPEYDGYCLLYQRTGGDFEVTLRDTLDGSMKNQVSNAWCTYTRHGVRSDGDCGYTAFGITRQNAFEFLKSNTTTRVKNIIDIAVKQALVTEKFYQYLKGKKIIAEVTPLSQITDNIDRYAVDLAIVSAYLEYDIIDKQIDAGWAHPAILQALADIQKIRLRIWRLGDDGKLVPHSDEYEQYTPDGFTQTSDILFVNGNHFELLKLQGVNDQDVYSKDIYPLNSSPSPFDGNTNYPSKIDLKGFFNGVLIALENNPANYSELFVNFFSGLAWIYAMEKMTPHVVFPYRIPSGNNDNNLVYQSDVYFMLNSKTYNCIGISYTCNYKRLHPGEIRFIDIVNKYVTQFCNIIKIFYSHHHPVFFNTITNWLYINEFAKPDGATLTKPLYEIRSNFGMGDFSNYFKIEASAVPKLLFDAYLLAKEDQQNNENKMFISIIDVAVQNASKTRNFKSHLLKLPADQKDSKVGYVEQYLFYAIQNKQEWPAILLALAHYKKIGLYLWQIGDNELLTTRGYVPIVVNNNVPDMLVDDDIKLLTLNNVYDREERNVLDMLVDDDDIKLLTLSNVYDREELVKESISPYQNMVDIGFYLLKAFIPYLSIFVKKTFSLRCEFIKKTGYDILFRMPSNHSEKENLDIGVLYIELDLEKKSFLYEIKYKSDQNKIGTIAFSQLNGLTDISNGDDLILYFLQNESERNKVFKIIFSSHADIQGVAQIDSGSDTSKHCKQKTCPEISGLGEISFTSNSKTSGNFGDSSLPSSALSHASFFNKNDDFKPQDTKSKTKEKSQ